MRLTFGLGRGVIHVTLIADTSAAGVPVTAGPGLKWQIFGAAGVCHHGYNEKPVFTPLYGTLTNRKPGWRRSTPEPEKDDLPSKWVSGTSDIHTV